MSSAPGPADRAADAGLELLEPQQQALPGEVMARPGHLDERELQRQAWIAALAHVLDGDGEQIDEPQHLARGELVRLRAEALPRLLGHRQRIGHLAHVLHEHQMAEVLQQVGDESGHVLSLLGELLDERQHAGRVAVDDEVEQPEERIVLDGAEQLEHGRHRDLASRRGRELVERRDGVAEAAAGASPDEGERRVGSLDALAVRDAAQQPRQLAEPGTFEPERLAARPDRREHLREVGRAEDEDEVGRRLLDQLQERVEGGVRELMRLVEDVDLVAPLDRLQDDVVADLADVVDARAGTQRPSRSRRETCPRRSSGRSCTRCTASPSGPCAQLSALATIRASDVLPVPRGPANRYAWRT